jgi:hypothetical protein
LILIPGLPQWSWDQRERSLFLAGSFTVAVLVGVLTWGTSVGLGILMFAFATHVYSAVDAIRQNAFPGFGRLVPTLTASAGLGGIVYVPALVLASVYAWPVAPEERPREGYLVNRRAYRHEEPKAGETVWLDSKRGDRSKVARIAATSGQRIEWVGDEFRVDDKPVVDQPLPKSDLPAELKLTIPQGHLLVYFPNQPRPRPGMSGGWEIIEQREIRGRAWARAYPIWSRGLLR